MSKKVIFNLSFENLVIAQNLKKLLPFDAQALHVCASLMNEAMALGVADLEAADCRGHSEAGLVKLAVVYFKADFVEALLYKNYF